MARILLADDNQALLHMQREVLVDAGHDVTAVTSGYEALGCSDLSSYDLVITDIVMPEGDGIETIVALRKRMPAPKIIAISGGGHFSADDYLLVAEKLGAARTLAKPFTTRDLLATVDLVLDAAVAA